jgi:beta-aspartyl-peptidase (threonine type)
MRILFFCWLMLSSTVESFAQPPAYAIAIHGGAGTISRKMLSKAQEQAYRASLERALLLGDSLLSAGHEALDVAVQIVALMEDDSLFNAGKGSVFTFDGGHELDAAVMEGHTLRAGAVAGLKRIKNPVRLAREVMEQSPHVFLYGEGAEQFAWERSFEPIEPSYFDTERRRNQLRNYLKPTGNRSADSLPKGTVGAVVLDSKGNLAVATSTGGMTGKRWNRIGDSPIIGSGTYADNEACAVSCTGHGELFIRKAAAHDLAAKVKYAKMPLIQAAELLVMKELQQFGAEGGLVAIDRNGHIAMPFKSEGMYRGYKYPSKQAVTAIYADDPTSARP